MSLRELDPSAPVGGAAPEPPAVLVAEATAARARSRRRRMREQIGLAACGVWLAAVVICSSAQISNPSRQGSPMAMLIVPLPIREYTPFDADSPARPAKEVISVS